MPDKTDTVNRSLDPDPRPWGVNGGAGEWVAVAPMRARTYVKIAGLGLSAYGAYTLWNRFGRRLPVRTRGRRHDHRLTASSPGRSSRSKRLPSAATTRSPRPRRSSPTATNARLLSVTPTASSAGARKTPSNPDRDASPHRCISESWARRCSVARARGLQQQREARGRTVRLDQSHPADHCRPRRAPSPTTAPAAIDPCEVVTQAQATALVGTELLPGLAVRTDSSTDSTCTYTPPPAART